MKRFALALVLIASPLSAFAACGSHEQAMSCAEGTTWDQETRACVPTTS